MIFETLMSIDLITQVLAIGFVTIILIAIIEASYKIEELGDKEE